ncbi:MAG: hypothetical protein AAF598_08780 [Bacteroidota bacterium]
MMKYIGLLCLILLFSCQQAHKSSQEEVDRFQSQFSTDPFSLSGDFHWSFQLMGGTQHSVHTLFPDQIRYSMDGRVYSTDYTMEKLSYDQSTNKWIGRDENGIVYVLFFSNPTDSSLTIYKHKCKTNGIEEALAFERPAPDATTDHGWNVYASSNTDPIDILPLQGIFANETYQLDLSDQTVIFNEQAFEKLSYHQGERRWVGQHDSIYLQLFFEHLDDKVDLSIAVAKHTDLEQAYQIKFQEVAFAPFTRSDLSQ